MLGCSYIVIFSKGKYASKKKKKQLNGRIMVTNKRGNASGMWLEGARQLKDTVQYVLITVECVSLLN